MTQPASFRTGVPVWRSPGDEAPAMTGHESADAVVVGAGIAGMTTAVSLAEQGADVLLLDRQPLGAGVTGRSNAKITALHQARYHQLADRHGSAAAAAYASAQSQAIAWLRARAGEVLQTRTAATVARTAEEGAILAIEAASTQAAGLTTELQDGMEGFPDVRRALVLADQAQVDPVALLQRLHAGAPRALRLRRGVVAGVIEGPRGARVRGEGFTVDTPAVVLATGLPILDRGAFFALADPQASYLVALEHDDAPPRHPMLISVGEPTRSVRWTEVNGRPVMLVGGCGHRIATGDPTAAVQTLESWARAHYSGLGRLLGSWSAEDYMSADLLPMAGPQWRFGGPVHIITGLSKWGFTLGVACGRAVAARIAGDELDAFAELVDTARLPDRQAFGALASNQAAVARNMSAGWLRAMRTSDEATVHRRNGLPVGVCRVGDKSHAVLPVCPHLGGVVAYNPVDERWDCPLHGSRFHADGTVAHGPAIRGLAPRTPPSDEVPTSTSGTSS